MQLTLQNIDRQPDYWMKRAGHYLKFYFTFYFFLEDLDGNFVMDI